MGYSFIEMICFMGGLGFVLSLDHGPPHEVHTSHV